jgi:hypothetical protein
MATSTELENVGREHYMVKDVKAKIQVDLISKDSKKTEVDDQDFYVCVNRDVESKFIKADESSEDKIDQFIVKHHETITIVQGLANTKLTNPDNWIIKIKRKLSETTFFKGKEIIDKISQRQENLERNKENPIVKAAIAKELLKRSKQEQKIGSIHNKEPLDENQNSIGDEKGNQHFMAETSPETSPDTSKDDEQGKKNYVPFRQRFVSSTGNMEVLLSHIHSVVCAYYIGGLFLKCPKSCQMAAHNLKFKGELGR